MDRRTKGAGGCAVLVNPQEQVLRVLVLWRHGFRGKSEEWGLDYQFVYFKNVPCSNHFSSIFHQTFNRLNESG